MKYFLSLASLKYVQSVLPKKINNIFRDHFSATHCTLLASLSVFLHLKPLSLSNWKFSLMSFVCKDKCYMRYKRNRRYVSAPKKLSRMRDTTTEKECLKHLQQL